MSSELTYTGPRDIDLDESWLDELIHSGGVEIAVSLWDDRSRDRDEIARIACAGMTGSQAHGLIASRANRAISVLSGLCKIHCAVLDDSGRTIGWAPFTLQGGGLEEGATPTPDERGVIAHLLRASEVDKKYLADYQRAFVGSALRENEKKDRKIEKLEGAVEAMKAAHEKTLDRTTERKIAEKKADAEIERSKGVWEMVNTVATVIAAKAMPPGHEPKLRGPVMSDLELLFFRIAQLAANPRWETFIGQAPKDEQLLWLTIKDAALEHGQFMNAHTLHASQTRLSDIIYGWAKLAEEKFSAGKSEETHTSETKKEN